MAGTFVARTFTGYQQSTHDAPRCHATVVCLQTMRLHLCNRSKVTFASRQNLTRYTPEAQASHDANIYATLTRGHDFETELFVLIDIFHNDKTHRGTRHSLNASYVLQIDAGQFRRSAHASLAIVQHGILHRTVLTCGQMNFLRNRARPWPLRPMPLGNPMM